MEETKSDNDQRPASPNNLQIVFYLPNQSPASRRSKTPTWERLTEQVGSAIVTQRFHLQDCLKLFSVSCGDTALEIASNLTRSLSHNKKERATQCLLLLSLCTVLDVLGRAAPEEIDEIVGSLTKSTKMKYLDELKRGARVANEIIAAWAER